VIQAVAGSSPVVLPARMTREAWERSVKPSFRHGWFDSSTWHRAPMVQRIGRQPPKLVTQVRVLLGARYGS
jgi:hypothetical protein